jgi:hypothetical protein
MALATVGELRVFGATGSGTVAGNAAGRILFEWVMPTTVDGHVRVFADTPRRDRHPGPVERRPALPGSRRVPASRSNGGAVLVARSPI